MNITGIGGLIATAKPWVPEDLPAGTVRNDWNPLAQYVTLNAGKVVTWADSTGSGEDLNDMGVAGGRPVYTAAGPGGYPQVDFDGIAQTLGITAAPPAFNLPVPYTFCLVYQQTGAVNALTLVSDSGGTAFQFNPLVPSVSVFSSPSNWVSAGATLNSAAFGVTILEVNGVNSAIYNNGVLRGTSNPTNLASLLDTVNLGAYQYQPFSSLFLPCSIARVLLLNGVLSAANRTLLTNYMRRRYATP